jgi:hypothetical protein
VSGCRRIGSLRGLLSGDGIIGLIWRPEICLKLLVFLFIWQEPVSKFLQERSKIVHIWGLVLVR